MNSIKKIFYLAAMLLTVSSCEKYDDYLTDSIGNSGVYFPFSKLERSVIAEEGDKFKFSTAVILGGVRENIYDHRVIYEIDETLLADFVDEDGNQLYEMLPEEYYTMANDSEFNIPAGEIKGFVEVAFDEQKCYADPKMLDYHYALPLSLVTSTADIILNGFETCVYPVKMINTYEGYFYHVGHEEQYAMTPNKTLIDAVDYGTMDDVTVTNVVELKTSGYNKVIYSPVGTQPNESYNVELEVNSSDNTVSIGIPAGSLITKVEVDECTWDPANRVFTLDFDYYLSDNDMYEVTEELVFRNRIRDGLSEWRWEGFDGN